MHSSSLTSKGQITIPSEIRNQLGLHPGDKVGFLIENDHVIIFRKQNDIEAAFGICQPKQTANLNLPDIDDAAQEQGGNNAID